MFENVIEAMVDAVLVVDVEGGVTLTNTAAARLTGYSVEELEQVLAPMAEDGTEIAEIAVNYGSLIATILDFVLIAFAIFCLLKAVNGFHDKLAKKKAEEPAAPPAPSAEEKLLTEIRDLLKEKN